MFGLFDSKADETKMSLPYPSNHYQPCKKQPPSPKSIDFQIYRMGGSTLALDCLRETVPAQQSNMSLEQLVTNLNTKLIRVTEELQYYERIVAASQFSSMEDRVVPTSMSDSSRAFHTRTSLEELQRQIYDFEKQLIDLKELVDHVLGPILPVVKVHVDGLQSALRKYNSELQRKNIRQGERLETSHDKNEEISIRLDI